MASSARETCLVRSAGYWTGRFRAMASPCEVLIEAESEQAAHAALDAVAACAWRIEDKYSRYRDDNIVHTINSSAG